MKSHRIKIGFSSPKGKFVPFSWAIKVFQNWYVASHVYISYTSKSGIPMVYQSSGRMNNFMALHKFKEIAIEEIEFELHLDAHEFDLLMWKFDLMAGTPYSVPQAMGIFIKKLIGWNPFKNGRKASICTETVARILVGRGFDINEVENLTPKDIFDILSRDSDGNTQKLIR